MLKGKGFDPVWKDWDKSYDQPKANSTAPSEFALC
jgi:hypothetical protein